MNVTKTILNINFIFFTLIILSNSSCIQGGKGSVSGSASGTTTSVVSTTNTYTIGGTISGLSGTVILQNNDGDNLSLTANGAFTFATSIKSGSNYEVKILTQPSAQTCSVTANGTAQVGSSNISNVTVVCTTNTFTIGGTISGLIGTATLHNNVVENNTQDSALTVTSNGAFTFTTAINDLTNYQVTVTGQPTNQTCSVTANGTGVINNANISGVSVVCTNNSTIGGTLSGLGTGETVKLKNNSGDELTLTANGAFTFATSITTGSTYSVTISNQPITQKCVATSASGTANSNITSVVVTCYDIWFLTHFGTTTVVSTNYNIGSDSCSSVAVDSNKNVYCAGYSSGQIGTGNTGSGIFVMKLSSTGSVVWVKQNFGNSSDTRLTGIAVDTNGNVLCSGYTVTSIGDGETSNTSTTGGTDVFILKLAPNGNTTWITQLGNQTYSTAAANNNGFDYCNAIAVDSDGAAYCGGSTSYEIGAEANGGGGNLDAFIMKVDTNGDLMWVKQLGNVTKPAGGSNAGVDECKGVAVFESGSNRSIYCAGGTTGGMGEANGNGSSSDIFVAKFAETVGTPPSLSWVTQLGSVTRPNGTYHLGDDYANSVATDTAGNVYFGGYTTGKVGEANGGVSGFDAVIGKLNASGTPQWTTQLGATTFITGGTNAGEEKCNGVAVDSSNNVYCGGNTRSLSNGGSPYLSFVGEANGGAHDSHDVFMLKLNSSGALEWAKQLGGTTYKTGGSNTGNDYCNALAIDLSGNLYCAGNTTGNYVETNAGTTDAYILRLNHGGSF